MTVETVREAEDLLTDKTIFWVVKPQLFAGNVTGLDTLLSGSYIGMRPSTEKGKPQRDFVGKRDPPVLQASAKGTTFKLESKRLGSISLGSPIFFRDLEVGTVLGWDLGDLASNVAIHAFVRDPYDKYVHDDSSFWNASGLSIKLGANGVDAADGIAAGPAAGRHRLRYAVRFRNRRSARPAIASRSTPAIEVGASRRASAASCRWCRISPARSPASRSAPTSRCYGLKIGEVTDVGLRLRPQAGSHRGAGALSHRGRPHHRHLRRRDMPPGHARRGNGQARACAPRCRRRA